MPELLGNSKLRLIAVLALVMAPHFARAPLWVTLFAASVLVWQTLAELRDWRPPGALLRAGMTLVAFVGVYTSFGRIDGQHAGASLLVLMLSLKLTETRRHRDVMILLGLCYFVLITHFLFSQSIAMAAFLGFAAWLITACFLDANHPQGGLPLKTALRGAAALVIQALPVAALLFVLFPRIPGPLWGLPSDAGTSARSGLSDSMAPGMITQLALSDAVAMRVRFRDSPPPPDRMYWRGPVFWAFDGHRWTQGVRPEAFDLPTSNRFQGEVLRYEVTLEPHRNNWLLALDLPVRGPSDAGFSAAGTMLAREPVTERRLYQATSYTEYALQLDPPERVLDYARRLPVSGNPQSRALADQWREAGLSPSQIVDQALNRFREQPYIYTLQPPPVSGADHIDRFLFETQSGFCEHYAGAFTFLMRAAGIPARVVTGYQGAEPNDLSDYYIVRSADAHAWSEVWLADRGWVRVDPTSAVAPERIANGIGSALGAGEPLPYMARHSDAMLYRLQLSWDLINAAWDRWFLAYGPELQERFLSGFGLTNWRSIILALTAVVTAFLALLGAVLIWQARPRGPDDPVQAQWLRFCERLATVGIERRANEGPADFGRRAATYLPHKQQAIRRIVALYIGLRYRQTDDTAARRRFRDAVGSFKPKAART